MIYLDHNATTPVLPEVFEAMPAGTNQFGHYYEIRGPLRGPSGLTLRVKTTWMREHLSGTTRFITLLPD